MKKFIAILVLISVSLVSYADTVEKGIPVSKNAQDKEVDDYCSWLGMEVILHKKQMNFKAADYWASVCNIGLKYDSKDFPEGRKIPRSKK